MCRHYPHQRPFAQHQRCGNASEYILQVSESENFDTTVIEETVSQNNYTVQKGKLDFDKKYYWRVKVIINNVPREWSEVFNFSTLTLSLTSPQLVHPPDNALDVPLTVFFEWEAVANADEYILLISDNDQFTNSIYNDTLITTIYNMKSGVFNWETDYYWKVKSKFLEFESEWSPARTFKTTQELSVEDNLLLSQIDLNFTPNPADKLVEIAFSIPFKSRIKIYLSDIKGKKLFENNLNLVDANNKKSIFIPLENITSGNYFIILETGYGIITRRLAVQR